MELAADYLVMAAWLAFLKSRLIVPKLQAIPGLVDLDSTLKPDKPTVAINVRREAAADVGLNVNALAGTLRTLQ